MMDNEQHHWIGQKPDPSGMWGFVYMIEHLPSGQRYAGKKQYRASAGPKPKQKCRTVGLPAFKEWHWKENDWRWYSGSSKHLTKFKKTTEKDEWEHTILGQYDSSGDLHYAEIQLLIHLDAMTLVDEDGEYIYFNRNVPGMKFRPPTTHTIEVRSHLAELGKGPRYEEAQAALGAGAKTFVSSTPCPNCGGSEFNVQHHKTAPHTMECTACNRVRALKRTNKKRLAENPEQREKRLTYMREYYHKNKGRKK